MVYIFVYIYVKLAKNRIYRAAVLPVVSIWMIFFILFVVDVA